jgi:hypothetical protein
MTHRSRTALSVALALLATAPAAASPAARPLPAAAVVRIPDAVARVAFPLDPNAPLARGEFATSVRVAGDRTLLREQIERQRAAEAARFARGAGPGIAVRLRRSKY